MCWLVKNFRTHENIKYRDKKKNNSMFSFEPWAIDRKTAWNGLTKGFKVFLSYNWPQTTAPGAPPSLLLLSVSFLKAPSVPLTEPQTAILPTLLSSHSSPYSVLLLVPFQRSLSCPSPANHLSFTAAPLQHLWFLHTPLPEGTKYWPQKKQTAQGRTYSVLEYCLK